MNGMIEMVSHKEWETKYFWSTSKYTLKSTSSQKKACTLKHTSSESILLKTFRGKNEPRIALQNHET